MRSRCLFLAVTSALALAGCGGDSSAETSSVDADICDAQASELADARDTVERLQSTTHWGSGEPESIVDELGSAVVTLTGYSPDDARLARAVDRARDDVQALHDDLAADATLTGDGQTGRTAMAALSALDDACA